MTHAELLRKHATDATNEGGMWFSGEYMTMLASMAESIEAENAKLRELVSELWVSCPVHDSDCYECQHKGGRTGCELYDRMLELEVEVDA